MRIGISWVLASVLVAGGCSREVRPDAATSTSSIDGVEIFEEAEVEPVVVMTLEPSNPQVVLLALDSNGPLVGVDTTHELHFGRLHEGEWSYQQVERDKTKIRSGSGMEFGEDGTLHLSEIEIGNGYSIRYGRSVDGAFPVTFQEVHHCKGLPVTKLFLRGARPIILVGCDEKLYQIHLAEDPLVTDTVLEQKYISDFTLAPDGAVHAMVASNNSKLLEHVRIESGKQVRQTWWEGTFSTAYLQVGVAPDLSVHVLLGTDNEEGDNVAHYSSTPGSLDTHFGSNDGQAILFTAESEPVVVRWCTFKVCEPQIQYKRAGVWRELGTPGLTASLRIHDVHLDKENLHMVASRHPIQDQFANTPVYIRISLPE